MTIGVMAGAGFTVTSTLNGTPVHVPDSGVTEYVTRTGTFIVLLRIPVTEADPIPGVPPVNPAPAGAVQLYVVPAGTIPSVIFTGVTVNVEPLQIVADIVLTAGFGLTVTVRLNGVPVQLPETGTTVYVAV
jgi:hypothetical protein